MVNNILQLFSFAEDVLKIIPTKWWFKITKWLLRIFKNQIENVYTKSWKNTKNISTSDLAKILKNKVKICRKL